MPRSKHAHLSLAVAVSAAVLSFSAQIYAEELQDPTANTTAKPPAQASIYDTWATVHDSSAQKDAKNPSKAVDILRDVKVLTQAMEKPFHPLVNEKGELIKKDFNIRIDGPSGETDENGRPLTHMQKLERELTHKQAFALLKAQGYSWEEHKKKIEEKKKEPDEWQVKTEETRRYIEEHGPITSKNFVRPGLTPEQSAALDSPNNSMMLINGKWVIVDGKTKRPVLEGVPIASKEQKRIRETAPLVTVTTKITQRPARSSDLAVINAAKRPIYTQPTTPELVNDIIAGKFERENPTLTMDEVQKLFPDLKLDELKENGTIESVKQIRAESSKTDLTPAVPAPATKPAGDKKGVPVSFLERISGPLQFFLGISQAHAAENPGSSDLERAHELLQFKENPHLKANAGEYAKIVEEMDKQARDIEKAVIKRTQKLGEKTAAGADDGRAYLDEMMNAAESAAEEDGKFDHTAEAAKFAAEIVHLTGSLTTEEFNDDVKLLTDMLTDKRTGEAYIGELRRILRTHPEIQNLDPSADLALDQLAKEQFGMGEGLEDSPRGTTSYVFLSRSLGEKAIKDILERASMQARRDLVFVFRGVPEGKTINDGILEIQKLGQHLSPMPNTVVDPALFKKYDVKVVPTVVRAQGRSVIDQAFMKRDGADAAQDGGLQMNARQFGKVVARVEGLDNDQWLLEQVDDGREGDLGIQGDVQEISEPDLIDVMKKKFMEVNWEEKRRNAIKNAWKKQNFIDLPMAETARVRHIDPTILVEKDLKDLSGRPIRKAGDRVNPLVIQPFNLMMLIFDPLREEEMKRVGLFLSRNKLMGKPNPVLIATRIDKEEGWKSYKSLTDRLDQHVFVLTSDVQERFEIEATPSVVTADNQKHVFVVEELGPIPQKKDSGEAK